MFKIKIERSISGRKKVDKFLLNQQFASEEDCVTFITKNSKDNHASVMRQVGLCLDTLTREGNVFTLKLEPAIIFAATVTYTYTLVKV